ncbi:MAG: four helix bundle protein [Armatimonadota bacterium]
MDEQTFKRRTKRAALDVIKLVDGLPRRLSTEVMGRQLLRSSTSVGSNYRSACRGKSRPDMISKLHIVEEETDESIFWLEMLCESGALKKDFCAPLMQEYGEILAMTVASIKTLQLREADDKNRKQVERQNNLKSKIKNPKYDAP